MFNSETITYPNGVEAVWTRNGQFVEQVTPYYHGCRNGPGGGAPLVMAYTLNSRTLRAPSVIHLCAVFLARTAAQRWWSSEQVDPQ